MFAVHLGLDVIDRLSPFDLFGHLPDFAAGGHFLHRGPRRFRQLRQRNGHFFFLRLLFVRFPGFVFRRFLLHGNHVAGYGIHIHFRDVLGVRRGEVKRPDQFSVFLFNFRLP